MKKIKRKKYSTGGDIAKGIGAGLYGVTEGFVDNISMGATDQLTDKGYDALSKLGKNSKQFQKTSNIIRSSGNIAGQVTGAVLSGGATTTQAISGGLKSGNDIVQNTNMNPKAKKWIGLGSNLASTAVGLAGGGLNADVANSPEQIQNIMNMTKNIQFQNGGWLDGIKNIKSTLETQKVAPTANGKMTTKTDLQSKTDSIRKQYNIDRSNNDTWLDIPTKALTWATGYGYKKPSDMLYDKGLAKYAPNTHQEIAASFDKALDPIEWLTTLEKAGGQALGSLAGAVLQATRAKEIYDYGKSRASDVNNWLGETTGYKFADGGSMKDVILDGKLVKKWVASDGKLYDQNPNAGHGNEFYGDDYKPAIDKVFKENPSFNKLTNYRQEVDELSQNDKRDYVNNFQNQEQPEQLNPSGKQYNYNGVTYKKLDNGKYAWYSKSQGVWKEAKNFNDDFVKRNGLDNTVKKSNSTVTTAKSFQKTSLNEDKYDDSEYLNRLQKNRMVIQSKERLSEMEKLGDIEYMKKYPEDFSPATLKANHIEVSPKWVDKFNSLYRPKFQQGGQMPQNLLPQNPNDIEDETENTVEYQGNPHTQGGIPLQNGAELEKNETVVKPGVVGNKDPYAISPNLILDRNTAKQVGLPSKYAGYKLSDISRMIEDIKPKQAYGDKATAAINKKFALKKLMQANELLSAQHRQENGEPNEMSDLRQEEMAFGGDLPTRQLQREYENKLNAYELANNGEFNDNLASRTPYVGNNWKEDVYIGDNVNILGEKPIRKDLTQFPKIAVSNEIPKSFKSAGTVQDLYIPSKKEPFKMDGSKAGMALKTGALLGELALIGRKPETIPAQYNPYREEIRNAANRSIDFQPIKNSINSSIAAATKYNTDRSFNVQRGLNANTYAAGLSKLQEAEMAGQQLNNQYKGEYAQTLDNLGTQDVQARNKAEVLNTQTQDNWKNRMASGLQNVGNDYADMLIKKDVQEKFNQEHFQILKERGADYGINVNTTDDYMAILKGKNGDMIVGKMVNEETLTPAEIKEAQESIKKFGKGTDYNSTYGVKPTEQGISTLQMNIGKPEGFKINTKKLNFR